jgi:prophage DNA circulation protein
MVPIVLGDEIPVVLFLQGQDTNLFPLATIRQADGTLIDVIELVHQSNGVYVSSEAPVAMPSTEFVTVAYTVYTDALWTTESLRYNPTIDAFVTLGANIKYQNSQPLYGTGTPGDPWRGYP